MKPTARARIERAVRAVKKSSGFNVVYHHDALRLILAERARLKRGVSKLREQYRIECDGGWTDYLDACDDILALWEK